VMVIAGDRSLRDGQADFEAIALLTLVHGGYRSDQV
jgi:hypothetical protein